LQRLRSPGFGPLALHWHGQCCSGFEQPWKGAAKLKAAKDSKGYGDMPKPSLERRLGQASVAGVGLKSCTGGFSDRLDGSRIP